MGSFTTIVSEDGLIRVQIYGGNDICAEYKIGTLVDWYANPERVGSEHLMDGVYEGYVESSPGGEKHAHVVIKDHMVTAILFGVESEQIEKDYGPFPSVDDMFTKEAWEREKVRRMEAKTRYQAHLQEYLDNKGITEAEMTLSDALVFPIFTSMHYQTIGKQMLSVEPVVSA